MSCKKDFFRDPQISSSGFFPLHSSRALSHKHEDDPVVLDLGCGPGTILGILDAAGADLWGIDISENAIEIAKKMIMIKPKMKY